MDPPTSPLAHGGHVRRISLGGAPLTRSSSVLLADYLDAAGESLPPDVAPLSPGHVKTEDSGGRPYVGERQGRVNFGWTNFVAACARGWAAAAPLCPRAPFFPRCRPPGMSCPIQAWFGWDDA